MVYDIDTFCVQGSPEKMRSLADTIMTYTFQAEEIRADDAERYDVMPKRSFFFYFRSREKIDDEFRE